MDVIYGSILRKIFTLLPKIIVRWKFTKGKLSDSVKFDIQSRNEPVRVNVVGNPDFQLRFNIINLSPVDIELEQAEIKFVCAGVGLKRNYVKRMAIKCGKTEILNIEESISKDEANEIIKRHKNKDDNTHISANLDFNCKIHNFSKHKVLNDIKPEFINMPE